MKTKSLYLFLIAALIAAAFGVGLPAQPVRAGSTITVNTSADATVNDGFCSLREAIINANNDAQTWVDCAAGSGSDMIDFLDLATITVTSELPLITSNITIAGMFGAP